MREQAQERIGHMYPKASLMLDRGYSNRVDLGLRDCGSTPACGIDMPLVHSWWLGRKKGKEAYIVPSVVEDSALRKALRIFHRA